ncbi:MULTISPECIES: hypothetical protein [Clostridium]|uniref:Uncharacterized protein n=1 Tax=Clostridium frigoriphilum TaxID=443253 RepID=A0ABU7UQ89_9CLOT|nr:hypothetical protein [Clostridium sp. DSM 17811]MBU3100696.1 hypothetical protein [Clostridium sp. DSM 17811]
MKNVKNSVGKTVCRVDNQGKIVEILHKGVKTLIKFLPDGNAEIINVNQK